MKCDIVFVCQSGELERQAVLLTKSIRLNGGTRKDSTLHAIVPVPSENYGTVRPEILDYLLSEGVQIHRRPNPINDQYCYGNKMSAFDLPGDAEAILLLDTDTYIVDDFSPLLEDTTWDVKALPAMVNAVWPGDWKSVYKMLDQPIPLKANTRKPHKAVESYPYYNAGVILARRTTELSKRWIETAHALIDKKIPSRLVFPLLDQISLPLAIQRASLRLDDLSDAYNFHVGMWLLYRRVWALRLLMKSPPPIADAKILHYRTYSTLTKLAQLDDCFRTNFSRVLNDIPLKSEFYEINFLGHTARRYHNLRRFLGR